MASSSSITTSSSLVMGAAVGLVDDFGIFLDATTAFGAVAACFGGGADDADAASS